MKFTIRHITTYTYSQPVFLNPQILRFRPRYDGTQEPRKFKLEIQPEPALRTEYLSPEGNTVTKAWFQDQTTLFRIDAYMEVETIRDNPFDYVVDPPGTRLPLQYEEGLHNRLQPYIERGSAASADVDELARSIAETVQYQPAAFLTELNSHLQRRFARAVREDGPAWLPAFTLTQTQCTSRDLTVLFMDACRSQGMAARFVSGYHRGALEWEKRYLHAWPEVYVPGGGWRAFDPMHGLAVGHEHVAIAAAANPADTLPVSGAFSGPASSSMQIEVSIQAE
jgi:transglutaminase-like putative cysteine protease